MSAIRSNSNRAEARKKRSTPYARVVVNSVFRFLGFVPVEDDQDNSDKECTETPHSHQDTTSETTSTSENAPAASDNSARQLNPNASRDPFAIANSVNIVHPGSSSLVVPSAKHESTNPDHAMEIDNTPAQRFAFTYSVPGSSSFSSLAESACNDTPTTTPRKKLERNPNGIYRWEGAGSAKHARPRNRYASPAFGASPLKPARVVMKDSTLLAETSFADNKRRKVGEEGAKGSRQFSDSSPNGVPVPFPATSSPTTPRTNGVSPKSSPLSSSSRLRTPAKPTAPVVPSPLRQAWSDSSSPSSRDEVKQSPSHPSKQTKTANFMAELIKETTPPKKPDLSNPYQTASPVGKVGPPRRGTKRPRATGKPLVPAKEGEDGKQKKDGEKEKEKDLNDYSPQAIIEATVPKGSKRSRPPAHFEKRASSSEESSDVPPIHREPPVIVETRKQVYTVEEPYEDDSDSGRASKKSKPSINGNGLPSSIRGKATSPSTPEIIIEEIGSDVVMEGTGKDKEKEKEVLKLAVPAQNNESTSPASASSPTSRSAFGGFKPSSIPKEPSKLRFSFQAEGSSAPPSPAPTLSSTLPQTPPPLPKSEFKFSPPSESFSFTFKADDKATSPKSQPQPLKQDAVASSGIEAIKAKVHAMGPSLLPQFVFTLSATSVLPSTADHVKAQNAVKSLLASSLPNFEFGSAKSAAPFSFNFDPSKPKPSSSRTFKPSPPKAAKTGFSGFTLPSVPSSGFTFGSEPSKSITPAATSPTPVQGFNFAAAGMKPPTVKTDTWTCSLCGLSNPSSVSNCETCETPSPSASPAPVQGFNFAAAGMKPPTVKKDTWTCSLCGLSNPSSASKCETCDTPSPSGSPAPATAAISMPLPPAVPTKGFNFAAAGMKWPTATKGTWTCSLCGLSSPDSASKCVACETPK